MSRPVERVTRGVAVSLRGLAQAACVLLVATVAGMVVALALGARGALSSEGLRFVSTSTWDPAAGSFGALTVLADTWLTSALALALAVPGGFLVALYVTEFAPPRARGPLASLVEVLAAVPGVVYGLWGIAVLVPFVREALARPVHHDPRAGFGVLSAALVLALMALPTITAVMRDVISAVPASLREAGLALGGTRWEVVRYVVLPHARAGLFAAVMLGLGRALGETMAVSMVIGGSVRSASSLLTPAHTAASLLLAELGGAEGAHASALSELGLVLLVTTVAFNLGAHGVVRRTLRRRSAGLSTGPSEGELGEAP
ncbi:MAG: phosphate ABC transporter permease subunit PstC [Myxococcales bacterium]|nr:phosphate ABC transporter permease subunit PstC [Myxococcales bacterium]MBL0195764.1 phosphate ABC transporter permease subunit PstC [Myxococcales bacterium]HQY60042.1 phosphate ABC transporter permease subunit PstC [Polyangiaceae bacterium]